MRSLAVLWGLILVLAVPLTGCEWIDSVVPTMPFNSPEGLVNPNDPLNKNNTITPGGPKDLTSLSRLNSIQLTWTNPEDADLVSAEITWGPTNLPGQTPGSIMINNMTPGITVTQEVSGLQPGTSYDLTLRLLDSSSLWSAPVSLTVTTLGLADRNPPGEVSNLRVEVDDSQVELLWTDPVDPDLAGIIIVVDGEEFTAEKSAGTVWEIYNNRYLIYNMDNGKAYGFTVKTKDLTGNVSVGLFRTLVPQVPASGIKVHFKNNEFTYWDPDRVTVQFYNQTGTTTQITGFPGRMTRGEENKWFGYLIPGAVSAMVKFHGVYQDSRESTLEKAVTAGSEWWFVPETQILGDIRGQWLNYDPEKIDLGLGWWQVGFNQSSEAYVHVTLTESGSYTLQWADSANGPFPLVDTVDVKVSLLNGAGTTAQVLGGLSDKDVGYPAGYALALAAGKYWIRLAPYYDEPVTGTARVRIFKN